MQACRQITKKDPSNNEQQIGMMRHGIPQQLIISTKTQIEHLLCPICINVVWKPIACAQNCCFSSFCQACITDWLRPSEEDGFSQDEEQTRRKCPKCKRPFRKATIPLINNLLSSLVLACYNRRNGCTAQIPYDSFEKHLLACEYRSVRCQGCKKDFISLQIEQHRQSCSFVEVQCGKCRSRLTLGEFQSKHGKMACLEAQLQLRSRTQTEISQKYQALKTKVEGLQEMLGRIIRGEPIPLQVDFYTSFQQNFQFNGGEARLVKSAWNAAKMKYDFLHFYVTTPIRTNSLVGFQWRLKVLALQGNLLLGMCSTLCPNSVDVIINKYGQLKKKQWNEHKYKFVRKQVFYFSEGDVLLCRYQPALHCLSIQNQAKGVKARLLKDVLDDLGDNFYCFYSMDILDDAVKFF